MTIKVYISKFTYDKIWGLAYRLLTLKEGGGMVYMPSDDSLGYADTTMHFLENGNVTVDLDIYTNDKAKVLDKDIYGFFMYGHTRDNIFFLDKNTYYSIRDAKIIRKWGVLPARYMRFEAIEVGGDKLNISEIYESHISKGAKVIKPNTVLKRNSDGEERFEDFDMNCFMENAYGKTKGEV